MVSFRESAERLARRHPVVVFLGTAYAASWLVWLPLVLTHRTGDTTGGDLWWLHYLGGLGPAVGAVVTVMLGSGRIGLRRLGARLSLRRTPVAWLITGALLPLGLLIVVVSWSGVRTGIWIDPAALTRTAKLPFLGLVGFLVVELVFFGLGEETGWRGFLWPRMRSGHGFLASTGLVTMVWATWHLPTFAYNANMRALGVGGTFGWVLSLFAGAVVLGWLTDGAGGSVLPAALFHGVLDVVFVSEAVAGIHDAGLGVAVTVIAAIVLAHSWWRARHGAGRLSRTPCPGGDHGPGAR